MLAAGNAAAQPAAAANACLACHSTQTDARLARPAALFADQDVHRQSGFACVDCHGGDPASADAARAHDRARGFRGVPAGSDQIAVCSRCHSDAEMMRRFSPRQRVDQAAEYATSVHGKQLAAGDRNVATCASCHTAHGIRLVRDAKSPVFPTNVAATCAACHASAAHMQPYKLPDGSPLPTHQLADYQKSVHYEALTRGNDLSAPTCNDCHGNHGAAPPGVGSVANVCGTCHAVFAQRFEPTSHAQIFERGCAECHSNHAVMKPSDAMLGSSGEAVCVTCHEKDNGAAAADAMRAAIERLKAGIDRSAAVVASVGNAGIEVSAQELALAEARSQLTLARTEVHAFDVAKVEPVIRAGLDIVTAVDRAGESANAELRFRRRGLAWSLAAILVFVVALGLKIREIEKRSTT